MKENQKKELKSGAYGVARENVRLEELTTFHVGGPCEMLLEVTSEKEVLRAIRYLRFHEIPFTIVGNGSNLLVRDGGLDGVVLKMGDKLSDVTIEGNTITAQAGAALSKVAKMSFRAGLTGLEELSGIPGTVGGCVLMNAGAYGREMKDVVASVHVIDANNQLITLPRESMDMEYRKTRMMREGMVVTEVTFLLQTGEIREILARYEEYTERRQTKQPLEKYSAGSTFKRPEGFFAGKLIQDAGLRGFSVNDAQVSEKHCGFIINNGHATAADVLAVIHHVQHSVQEQFGVALEPEVRILGKETDS